MDQVKKKKKINYAPFITVFLILMGAGFSFYYYSVQDSIRRPELSFYGIEQGSSIRPFALYNQDSVLVTQKDLEGKIVVADFFFATCKSICPTMSEQMSRVYEEFKNYDDIILLSHTIDPENDNVQVLKDYSRKFDADSKQWMFLTGDKKTIYDQALYTFKIGVEENLGKPLEEQFIHGPDFVLIDKHGRLRAGTERSGKIVLYNGTDEASITRLIADIKLLLKEG